MQSKTMQINSQVTVGGQPSRDDLNQLKRDGFKSVVNFRTAGEDDQPMSPDQESDATESLGMEYVHLPVSMNSMGPELVDRFRSQFDELPKPVFVHCASGKRAGAMVMMHLASEQGWSGQQTLEKAEQMGFECDKPELRQFVKQYVDQYSQQAQS